MSLNSLTRLFTSMFIHANFIHIAFNLFALAYLGVYAERAIGITRYLLVYVASGILAALFHGAIASYFLHNGNVVLIGASGAISGIFGIAAVAGNRSAYYWLFLQIIFAVIGSISVLPIAFTVHVGGFIAGVVMTDQSTSKIRTVKKEIELFSIAIRSTVSHVDVYMVRAAGFILLNRSSENWIYYESNE